MANYNLAELVKTAQKDAPLPATYAELDAQSKRKIDREAEAKGLTPEAVYAAIKAQAEKDAADEFDPGAIAAATRR